MPIVFPAAFRYSADCDPAPLTTIEDIESGMGANNLIVAYEQTSDVYGYTVSGYIGGPDGTDPDADLVTFIEDDNGWAVLYGDTSRTDWPRALGNPHQPDWMYGGEIARECARDAYSASQLVGSVSWQCTPPPRDSINTIESSREGRMLDGQIIEPWTARYPFGDNFIAAYVDPAPIQPLRFWNDNAQLVGEQDPRPSRAWLCAVERAETDNPAQSRPSGAPRWQ